MRTATINLFLNIDCVHQNSEACMFWVIVDLKTAGCEMMAKAYSIWMKPFFLPQTISLCLQLGHCCIACLCQIFLRRKEVILMEQLLISICNQMWSLSSWLLVYLQAIYSPMCWSQIRNSVEYFSPRTSKELNRQPFIWLHLWKRMYSLYSQHDQC